jgi:hypothetical protein
MYYGDLILFSRFLYSKNCFMFSFIMSTIYFLIASFPAPSLHFYAKSYKNAVNYYVISIYNWLASS